MNKHDAEYCDAFGDIPDTLEERINYIKADKKNLKMLDTDIKVCIKKIKRIRYKKISFVLYKIIRPSARPRVTHARGFASIYVPRASDNGRWFEQWYRKQNFPRIDTPCTITIKVYEKTPNSYSVKNKILAELGFLRPWKRTGDIDNYCKTILDMMQYGENGLLADDCLVIESTQKLYYSIKPRAEVEIKYMTKNPEEVIKK